MSGGQGGAAGQWHPQPRQLSPTPTESAGQRATAGQRDTAAPTAAAGRRDTAGPTAATGPRAGTWPTPIAGAQADAGPEAAAGSAALLVAGDIVTDVIARHAAPLAPGTDTAAEIRTVPGGAGANVACWAAYGGCSDVRLLGRVGADSAAWHGWELSASGVRPHLVVDPEARTGTVICLVDGGAWAERTFLTDSGASLRLSAQDWSDELLSGVGRLHLSGYLFYSAPSRTLVEAALASARARGVPVSVDPASAGFLGEVGVENFLALADGVDMLLPSEDEVRLLSGVPDAADGAAELSRRFPVVVVKRGAKGALVARDGAVSARIPAVPGVRALDSTGAGDAFTGAFLAAVLNGVGYADAATEGCRAGARAVTRVGARPGPVPERSTTTDTDATTHTDATPARPRRTTR